MKVFVNKEAGKLYDLFSSIFVACNLDYYYGEVEKINISISQEYRDLMSEVVALIKEDIEKYKMYFNLSNIAYSLIDMEKIWKINDLDDYLKYVESKDDYEIQKSILSFVDSYGESWIPTMDDEKFKSIINDNNLLFKFLNNKPIPSEEKWTIITIINDIEDFKKTFISLIKEYEKKYSVFIEKYESHISEYADFLETEIKEKGVNIGIPLLQLVDTKEVNTLCILPSYFQAYTIYQTLKKSEKTSYMLIGKYLDKVFQESNRESSVDKYVAVFKNLGDLNRYKFIKLLSQGEKYGQEIADELNITSATVSYHANNLLIANLLKMERYENKTYYSLNKHTLREIIDFIKKDLEL